MFDWRKVFPNQVFKKKLTKIEDDFYDTVLHETGHYLVGYLVHGSNRAKMIRVHDPEDEWGGTAGIVEWDREEKLGNPTVQECKERILVDLGGDAATFLYKGVQTDPYSRISDVLDANVFIDAMYPGEKICRKTRDYWVSRQEYWIDIHALFLYRLFSNKHVRLALQRAAEYVAEHTRTDHRIEGAGFTELDKVIDVALGSYRSVARKRVKNFCCKPLTKYNPSRSGWYDPRFDYWKPVTA